MRKRIFWITILAIVLLASACGERKPDASTTEATTETTTEATFAETLSAEDQAVVDRYFEARETMGWFRLMPMECDVTSKITLDGEDWYRVTQFENYDAFVAYLESLFAAPIVERLLANQFYREYNGYLYSVYMFASGTNPSRGAETYSVETVSPTKKVLHVTVEDFGSTWPEVAEYLEFTFPYEEIDGKWVFTDFPSVR